MREEKKIKENLRKQLVAQIELVNKVYERILTYSDVNSVLIEILSENNKHDPKELFKQR
jgi:hypothetical protein